MLICSTNSNPLSAVTSLSVRQRSTELYGGCWPKSSYSLVIGRLSYHWTSAGVFFCDHGILGEETLMVDEAKGTHESRKC